jgi:HEAT repeat protein
VIPILLLALAQTADEKASALIDQLRNDDAAARRKALDALVEIGKPAVPAILRTLAEEAPDLPAKVEGLVKKLAAKEWKERDEAMKGLARIGRRAVDSLKPHADVADPEVAWRVRTALAEIEEGRPREVAMDHLRNAALCEALGFLGEGSAAAPLVKELSGSPSAEVRLRAAEALGRLRATMGGAQADEAAEKVVEFLGSGQTTDRRARSSLVKTLGLLRSAAAVKALSAMLRDDRDLHVKRLAMIALMAIGDAAGAQAVVKALESEDPYLREAAMTVLSGPAGGTHGFDPRKDAAGNAEALGKFRAWWEKAHRKTWE